MGCDLAIVGGGVLGLAHATADHERGLKVEVLERCQRAIGASIRNFGMIWPIGQPRGSLRELGNRSATLWAQRAERIGLRCDRGRVFAPGLRVDIERHVLDYLARFLRLPEPTIARR